MKIVFADSFFESLEKMKRHNTWWYKIYETIRYNIPNFFKNLWFFRKEIYNYRRWDYHYSLRVFKKSLEGLYIGINTYSNEHDESLIPKLDRLKEVINLLETISEDKFIELSEKVHGEVRGGLFDETKEETAHNRIVFNYATELELKMWDDLWSIIKGNDNKGSDMRSWWY